MLSLPNLQVVAPTFAENLPKSLTPFEYVAQTAEQKCVGVYAAQVDRDEKEAGGELGVVISADTIVVGRDGEILEKPRNRAHHVAMLKALRESGEHKVCRRLILRFLLFPLLLLSLWVERFCLG